MRNNIDMFFVCLCFSWIFMFKPVTSLESGTNAKCTENGECMDNGVRTKYENNFNNDTNYDAPLMYYEVTDGFGNRYNVSDIKTLLSTLIEKSDNYDKIDKDILFVFRGVMVAVILFVTCVIICLLSACIYCCRINITDNRLKNDVEALAEKLQRECRFKKSTKTTLPPISESCNIINPDAGIFCV